MKLSLSVAYGLRAVFLLAMSNQNKPIPCRQLAEDGRMPERFLVQVLRLLCDARLVCATRGASGGYMLCRPAGQITLLEVIEAIDGPIAAVIPSDQFQLEPMSRLQIVLDAVIDLTRRELAMITVSQLIDKI